MKILKLIELLNFIIEEVRAAIKKNTIRVIEEAKDESFKEKDQRKLENVLGGSAGAPPSDKYTGMFVRDRKKKS